MNGDEVSLCNVILEILLESEEEDACLATNISTATLTQKIYILFFFWAAIADLDVLRI